MKTGMLGSADLVELVAKSIDRYNLKNVVIDPVMVCKGIDAIMVPDAAAAIKKYLVKRADVITPNTIEAAYLADMPKVNSLDEIKEAAGRIKELGAKCVVIKGGERMERDEAVDVFYDGKEFKEMSAKKIYPSYNHGAGCTYSAAVTAGLANGLAVEDAVAQAKAFITEALRHSFKLNEFSGCTNHAAYKKSL
jgi:pyridoxine kinase